MATRIEVLHSGDYGCDITDAEIGEYEALIARAVSQAYGGAEVSVAEHLGGTSAVGHGVDVDVHEVNQIVQGVWESGEFWSEVAAG